MGYYKNLELNKEFVNDIKEESIGRRIWNNLVALQNFQRNAVKLEMINETNCVCRKCGEIVKCLHDKNEKHQRSLCQNCV